LRRRRSRRHRHRHPRHRRRRHRPPISIRGQYYEQTSVC
jgi:hypothetical protein